MEIFTIGHSTSSYETFLGLLKASQVTAIADVRSAPYSRHLPQFNQERLKHDLRSDGIAYVFLGRELGGRPAAREFYTEGIADYEKMAMSDEFKTGLTRLIEGAGRFRIALMCSEKEPLECHRCLLVARALKGRGIQVRHIHVDGVIKRHDDIEAELLNRFKRGSADLFASTAEQLADAYRKYSRRAAFKDENQTDEPTGTESPG